MEILNFVRCQYIDRANQKLLLYAYAQWIYEAGTPLATASVILAVKVPYS